MVDGIEALEPEFYNRDTATVARDLLGKLLVRATADGILVARIVETEAYGQEDPASHSFRGPTARSRVMFGPPGHAYVYLIYGMHHCLNAVTEEEGRGGAVLIRSGEPLIGLETMWKARFPGRPVQQLSRHVRELASGPGKLCQALEIRTGSENGVPLFDGAVKIARRIRTPVELGALESLELVEDGRIGISRATDKAWRFSVGGSRFVSRKPAADARHRHYVPER